MSGRIRRADGFIAVDWGTTNRRAYLIEDGRCTSEFEDGRGILAVGRDGFEQAVGEIRERLGDKPLLLAGMIGSNRGWIEVPYAPCPAGLSDLAERLLEARGGNAVLVPGVALTSEDRADVMRGEEVQVLGAVESGDIPANCLVCHPGTHNKWIEVRDGRICSFRTVMTGELFNLLREKSILSDLLASEVTTGDSFVTGCRKGLGGAGLPAELFETRARFLLGRLDAPDAASFVSGLLIGEDVRIGLADKGHQPIFVMGRPELTRLYRAALAEAALDCREVDGEGAFIAGASKIVELVE